MSLTKEKYNQIKPTLEYLCDPIILAQAWKKSQSYIRSHNWYADILELDCSAINLERNIESWSNELAAKNYHGSPMKLVPAPKSDSWALKKNDIEGNWDWVPANAVFDHNQNRKREETSEPLRPLAHLSIKDQSIATAIMICIADAIETAQGRTDKEDQTCSYGNRLYCKWNLTNRAHFTWGNNTTYSKYFTDYERFLKRTAEKMALVSDFHKAIGSQRRPIYEVQLDISAFYDSISRNKLLQKLKAISDNHYKLPNDQTQDFWFVVKECFNSWKWQAEDSQYNSCLKQPLKNDGLPQGLVASGFFANAYMIDFDNICRELIDHHFSNFIIHDYCRYVDDIRFVISTDVHADLVSVQKQLFQVVSPSLQSLGITLNPQKTKFLLFSGKKADVSARMHDIQALASGPLDLSSLDRITDSLSNLFNLAATSLYKKHSGQEDCEHSLAQTWTKPLDVREDTILRFASNRLAKALQSQRKLVFDQDAQISLNGIQESIARRFIESWTYNPALTLLLKKALELFPSDTIIEPIWISLISKLKTNTPNRERCVAIYCIAEILRFSATNIKQLCDQDLPSSANLTGYLSFLAENTQNLLKAYDLPWYLKQQAGFFLATQCIYTPSIFQLDSSLNLIRKLHLVLNGTTTGSADVIIPVSIVAWQITYSKSAVRRSIRKWLANEMTQLGTQNLYMVLRAIALNSPDMFKSLIKTAKNKQSQWYSVANIIEEELGLKPVSIDSDVQKWPIELPLSAVIDHPDNPFTHENALLKLAMTLLEDIKNFQPSDLAPHRLLVSCENWINVQNPLSGELTVIKDRPYATGADTRYDAPTWISPSGNNLKLYAIGRLLRACAVGEVDFTVNSTFMKQDPQIYYGLKSSWFSRRLGMIHSPEALAGYTAPMSSWVTELLFRLLQWPGLSILAYQYKWPASLNPKNLLSIIKSRIGYQNEIYGKASQIPFYSERIKWRTSEEHTLRVSMVQTLMPKHDDFEEYGFNLDRPDYRAKHREHTAAVCQLVMDQLRISSTAMGSSLGERTDLIVFPELAVHQNDIDLLKRLSDKTRAIIFAGIVFHANEKGKPTNKAIWLIPNFTDQGRQWIIRWQGKWNLVEEEKKAGITPWRPYQLLIELSDTFPRLKRGFRISGSICYDATDMRLTADLRDNSDAFLIAAQNRDINTFDSMIDALHYHMFQHIILVNSGEFGGSCAKAPFKEHYHRHISHTHGNNQITISSFEIDMTSLLKEGIVILDEEKIKSIGPKQPKRKTIPAGLKRDGVA